MATTPFDGNIKHVFRYQEYRRTVFLHAANKDNYGRHRGHVLYGMKLHPSTTKTGIQIGPGAVHTGYGTKMFLDTIDPEVMYVDLDNVKVNQELSVLHPTYFGKRPLLVAIICKVHVYEGFNPITDPKGIEDQNPIPKAQQIETLADLKQPDLIEFYGRVVSWNRDTVQPALRLLPQKPIFPTMGEQGGEGAYEAYDYIKTHGDTTESEYASPPPEFSGQGDVANCSLQFDEILLGYVVIGFPKYSTANIEGAFGVDWTNVYAEPVPDNFVPSEVSDGTTWLPGISIIQVKNAWEAVEDVLGVDVLFGRNDTRVDSWPAAGVSALSQTAGQFIYGRLLENDQTYPLLLSPKFGTSKLDPQTGQYEPNWMNYRLPSFMKDGDDILWVMRRLDYLLRLWMNRTGDQVLVGQTQDGTAFDLGGGKFDFMPTLERILNKFDGGSSLTTNKNIITYMLASESGGANPYNKVLKSGAIPHADEQSSDINAILNTTMGDTHLGAIKALERCAWNILQYIIGVDAYRSWLRDIDNSQNPLGMFTDLPVNIPVQPSSFSGNMSTAYIPNSSTIVPAIRELVLRSERNVGTNFLINSSFWAVNSQNNLEGWSSTLSRSQLAGDVYCATGTLGNSGSFGQNVNLGGIVAGILAAAGNIVSASMLVRNQHSMTLRIRIFAENGSQLSGASVEVPAAEYPRTVSLSAKATLESARSIEVDLVNTSGQAATVTIYGVSLNAGMPNAAPASRANVDFLSRWGGTEAKLWGNLYLDNHHIFTGGGKIDTGGGQVITRGGVIYTRDPDTVPGAGQTNGGTIYTGGSQIHGETKNAEATAPYDFVTLSQLRGFTISIGGSGTQDVVVNGSTLTNYNEFRNVEITESTADGFRFPGLTIIRATGNVLFSGNVRVGDPAGGALGHRYSSMEKYPNGSFADNLTDPAVWAPPPYVHRTRDAWGLYYSIGPNNLKILVRKADNGDSFDREINTKVYMPGWRPFRVAGGNYDAKKCRNLANLIELSLKNKSGCGGGGGGGTGRGKRYADYHGYDDVDPLTDVMGAYGGQGMGGGRVGQPKYTNSFNYIGFGGLGVPGITYGDATAAFTIALGGRGGDGSTSGNGALGGLGGAGGGSLVVLADGDITVNPGVLLDASGWAGNSGAFDGTYYGGSGGGGGGGQVILVSMGDIYLTNASLSACGASGGYTAPSTGGGGGGGALVALAQGTVFSDGCSLFYNGGQSPSDPGQEGSYDFVSDYAVWNFPFGTRAISS